MDNMYDKCDKKEDKIKMKGYYCPMMKYMCPMMMQGGMMNPMMQGEMAYPHPNMSKPFKDEMYGAKMKTVEMNEIED